MKSDQVCFKTPPTPESNLGPELRTEEHLLCTELRMHFSMTTEHRPLHFRGAPPPRPLKKALRALGCSGWSLSLDRAACLGQLHCQGQNFFQMGRPMGGPIIHGNSNGTSHGNSHGTSEFPWDVPWDVPWEVSWDVPQDVPWDGHMGDTMRFSQNDAFHAAYAIRNTEIRSGT